jgi:hypothetical protein
LKQLNRQLEFSLFFCSIRFTSTQLASSTPFSLPGVASHPVDIATHIAPCHVSFPLNQDELADSASSFDNASSSRLSSRTETLNPYYHNMTLSLYHPTLTLYCYKKIISILITLPTTQSRLYFTSSLAKVPRHRSSTRRCHSLSLLSHVHRPFTQ